jgi:hypothetical protein
MPNWVYTTMTVTGSREDLDEFRDKAAKPYTTKHRGVFVKGKGYDFDAVSIVERKDDLSFWNFVAPTDTDAYFGPEKKPDNYDTMTLREKVDDAMKFDGDHWYDWNCRNWGTKWDACDTTYKEADGALIYQFSTAWSPATGAFARMVEQHPRLEFEFHCTEEQGWGVVFEGKDGELDEVRSWDIPSSHQEWIDAGQDCARCTWEDESYEDCPKPDAPTDSDSVISR